MKHYVIILDWATNDDSGVNIVGVAHDMTKAKEIFASAIDDEREIAEDYGWHIEEDSDVYFEAYEDGYYSQAHTVLYIQEVE